MKREFQAKIVCEVNGVFIFINMKRETEKRIIKG